MANARIRGIRSAQILLTDGVQEEINQELRRASLGAYADIVIATPVDEGTARNSWNISFQEGEFIDDGTGDKTIIDPGNDQDTIYITNGVPYIGRLNQGSSSQAPANFIESAILNHFDNITGGIT